MTSPSSLYFKDEIIEINQTFLLKTLIFQQNTRKQEIQVTPKGDQTSFTLKTLIFQQNTRNPRNIKGGDEVEGRVNRVIVPYGGELYLSRKFRDIPTDSETIK